MILRSRHTIAGAVCRAILRTAADSGYGAAESAAYKCALADLGCNPLQLCQDATRDYEVMLAAVNRQRTIEDFAAPAQLQLPLIEASLT